MLTGLHDAADGMAASRQAYEMISENLAHISVPGFRRHEVSIEAEMDPTRYLTPQQQVSGPEVSAASTDFTPGPLHHTANPWDVAILGEGFFTIQGPEGQDLYTRSGAFVLNSDRHLVTQGGLVVLGEGGPIEIPGDAPMSSIHIDGSGSITANGQTLGKLKLTSFSQPELLERVGTTVFRAALGQTPSSEKVAVQHGVREMANVSAVTELVSLVAAMRHYEAAQRAMKAINDAVQRNTTQTNG